MLYSSKFVPLTLVVIKDELGNRIHLLTINIRFHCIVNITLWLKSEKKKLHIKLYVYIKTSVYILVFTCDY